MAIRDETGEIARWIGTALDIDAERRAREELARLDEREHSVARTFQQASLPPRLPLVKGVLLHGVYKPGSADLIVGGDWYDAFVTRSGELVLSIGDVMVMGSTLPSSWVSGGITRRRGRLVESYQGSCSAEMSSGTVSPRAPSSPERPVQNPATMSPSSPPFSRSIRRMSSASGRQEALALTALPLAMR